MSRAELEVYSIPNKLGAPIPLDDHAVSVALPLWEHVVAYEEGEERVLKEMIIGYPRFKIHVYIEKLMNHYAEAHNSRQSEGEEEVACFIFPTCDVANRFVEFMQRHYRLQSVNSAAATVVPTGFYDVCAALFAKRFFSVAKAFWQHCGEIVGSRLAYDMLTQHLGIAVESVTKENLSASYTYCDEGYSDPAVERGIKRHIADVLQIDTACSDDCVSLTTSGMASIYAAFRLASAHHKKIFCESDPHMVVFGFPYLDTLKLLRREELNAGGVTFFGRADEADLAQLQTLLEQRNASRGAEGLSRVGAIFAEFPSNPLLRLCDLQRLSQLCLQHSCLLVVDDTIGSFANIDLLHGDRGSGVSVDLLCTSLTKTYSGRGDVLAGSLVISPLSRHNASLLSEIEHLKLPKLYTKDLAALAVNSKTFVQRTHLSNRGAAALAAFLQTDEFVSPLVESVYYPVGTGTNSDTAESLHRSLLRTQENLTQEMRDQGFEPGFGCLLSVVFKPEVDVTLFYDNLSLYKGPSLGTNFTLVSPYTLLAHYCELEWAEGFGVSRRLVRVSVGTEDPLYVQRQFAQALSKAVKK